MKTTVLSKGGIILIFLAISSFYSPKFKAAIGDVSKPKVDVIQPVDYLWHQYECLDSTLNLRDTLVFIDFSRPSNVKRLWVFDALSKDTILHTYVAHGKYTGGEQAMFFSNKLGSKKSSLGFYTTAETYFGSKGFSLKLDGLEYGFNHNARNRGIVIHGANYVSEDFLKGNKDVLGRSWGCPAVNDEINEKVIDLIKDNCLLFIYAEDNNYLSTSKMIKNVRNNSESKQYL